MKFKEGDRRAVVASEGLKKGVLWDEQSKIWLTMVPITVMSGSVGKGFDGYLDKEINILLSFR
jgi:hypothetical protein